MNSFLKAVAKQVFEGYGDDPSSHFVVFPNRRSSLFFARYLAGLSVKPQWAPNMITINQLFAMGSELTLAEPLKLIFELYKEYGRLIKEPGTFDDFYFWGEMMVNDFDDTDKYMVSAEHLFRNLKELKEIDEKFGGLDEDTIEVIRRFWINFDFTTMTKEKSDFLAIWEILLPLYHGFRKRLHNSGIGYEGMILREQAEKLEAGSWTPGKDSDRYHFVGFNALNRCEQRLMEHLKGEDRARFYWDYDEYYVSSQTGEGREEKHEAGYFLGPNIKKFGQDLAGGWDSSSLLRGSGKISGWNIISSPSDVAQAKLLPSILRNFTGRAEEPDETAIILADEKMLLPVLGSIPGEFSELNVTMGYPLYHTPVYSFVHNVLRLQKNARDEEGELHFYHSDVVNMLKHQYVLGNCEKECNRLINLIRSDNIIRVPNSMLGTDERLSLLFQKVEGAVSLLTFLDRVLREFTWRGSQPGQDENSGSQGQELQREYVHRMILSLNQLQRVIVEEDHEIGPEILIKLIDRIMRSVVVPFSGEPLRGLQVMGILETRALDFRNIVFLSVNEGKLPRSSPPNSYIPFSLREAFAMPTIKHQDSIYAYYFYRLLKMAENVSFIYNSSSEGLKTGEMSRFLMQLKYGSQPPAEVDSSFMILPSSRFTDEIEKEPSVVSWMKERYEGRIAKGYLSPSALNTWITCQMKFYYQYVCHIREKEEVLEQVDSPALGNILHEAMNSLYKPYEGKEVGREQVEKLLSDKVLLENRTREAFRTRFLKGGHSRITGGNLIIVEVVREMVERILKNDIESAPFRILYLEKQFTSLIAEDNERGMAGIMAGGYIDRIDQAGDTVRILDYKSGSDNLEIGSLDDLLRYDSPRNSAAFQTLVYCEIYSCMKGESRVRPALYPVRRMYSSDFSDTFTIGKGESAYRLDDYTMIRDQFAGGLASVISDVFDPALPFRMTTRTDACRYCPFASLCGRQNVR